MDAQMIRITHIDEVLPAIDGRTDFVTARREGYTAIDYVYAETDSFDDPIRRECRGLKFGSDGTLIARPFGKFFNIGERTETQPHLIDFAKPHIVMDKLDGSMVHPAIVGDDVVFMTRMGRSDHARQAERLFLTPDLAEKCRSLLDDGVTPIFEYTGPQNRIIIKYERPELTLLAARRTFDGIYLAHDFLVDQANAMSLPVVQEIASEWQSALVFLDFVRVLQGKEGFVIRFMDEHPERLLLKAKGEDYVLKHKSKEAIGMEKNVLALILANGLDDVLPLLSEEEQQAVEEYRHAVQAGLAKTVQMVEQLVESGATLDQKTFAVEHLAGQPSTIKSLAFSTRKSRDARSELSKMLAKSVNTQAQVDGVRELFGAEWRL
jgi:RNA ligase